MTFVNAILLAGGLLVAIPIVLHLIMRKQPRHQVFPAMRFLKLCEDANRRRLRFRHWLLLIARCAAICLLAAALARPSIQPDTTQLVALLAAVGAMVLVVVLMLVMVLVGRRNKPAL
ncbi:MAG: BatA domain-containing protein, partial [Planctomycetes bacterium]|nr:BatA domain-containing protein [Planctomycetota bacterium]